MDEVDLVASELLELAGNTSAVHRFAALKGWSAQDVLRRMRRVIDHHLLTADSADEGQVA